MGLAAMQMIPGNLTDPMATGCRGWSGEIADKPAQILVMGYVNGAIETMAEACDRGAKFGFCKRLPVGKVNVGLLMPADVSMATNRLCRQHAEWTMRQVAKRILTDAGVRDAR